MFVGEHQPLVRVENGDGDAQAMQCLQDGRHGRRVEALAVLSRQTSQLQGTISTVLRR